jgi:peptidoglycan hydrolase-like protein with peptidoglycan-binding domain
MNRAILVTVSAAALALSGCSMFRSEGSSQKSQAPSSSQPSYSQSSQSSQKAPSTAQSSTTSRSAAAQSGTSSSTMDYDNTASGTSTRMRMSGDELRQAQQKLKDDGDYTGQVDGKMGPKTAQALKKFQQSNGLPQTGRLDQQTASKLGVSMSGSSQPSSSSSSRGTTGTGSTGTTGTGSTNQ